MAAISLPSAFEAAYANFASYPNKKILRDRYGAYQLKQLNDRLLAREGSLFVDDDNKTFITVKDITSAGVVSKQNLCSNEKLKLWLGDTTMESPGGSSRQGVLATKVDPGCRLL